MAAWVLTTNAPVRFGAKFAQTLALSRRKQGFESPGSANDFRYLPTQLASENPANEESARNSGTTSSAPRLVTRVPASCGRRGQPNNGKLISLGARVGLTHGVKVGQGRT